VGDVDLQDFLEPRVPGREARTARPLSWWLSVAPAELLPRHRAYDGPSRAGSKHVEVLAPKLLIGIVDLVAQPHDVERGFAQRRLDHDERTAWSQVIANELGEDLELFVACARAVAHLVENVAHDEPVATKGNRFAIASFKQISTSRVNLGALVEHCARQLTSRIKGAA
jgi:hypothetical protein